MTTKCGKCNVEAVVIATIVDSKGELLRTLYKCPKCEERFMLEEETK